MHAGWRSPSLLAVESSATYTASPPGRFFAMEGASSSATSGPGKAGGTRCDHAGAAFCGLAGQATGREDPAGRLTAFAVPLLALLSVDLLSVARQVAVREDPPDPPARAHPKKQLALKAGATHPPLLCHGRCQSQLLGNTEGCCWHLSCPCAAYFRLAGNNQ